MPESRANLQSGQEFSYLIDRIDNLAGIISLSELLELADHIHDIVRSRRDKRFSASGQMAVELI